MKAFPAWCEMASLWKCEVADKGLAHASYGGNMKDKITWSYSARAVSAICLTVDSFGKKWINGMT